MCYHIAFNIKQREINNVNGKKNTQTKQPGNIPQAVFTWFMNRNIKERPFNFSSGEGGGLYFLENTSFIKF